MKIYNTMSRKTEELVPMEENHVRIYACGPTVYNYIHIGNARPICAFDVLRRYLKYKGVKVTYVQNFTDVDDKIIRRANEEGVDSLEISEKYIEEYKKDAHGLNVMDADVHPKVTESMDLIIDIVKKLVESGHAYEREGDVYFRTRSFETYGKLSGQPIEELQSGARIDVNDIKEDPLDFAVWKSAKPGEPYWESPWGKGRPGWHIECSAMSSHYLGETLDIHCGGQDLIFPHHENEIAQSECCNGKIFARYWMHNAFLNIDNKKMSKSLGNFFTVRDIQEKYDLQVLRFFMLSAHYRSQLNFSAELMEASKNALERIVTAENRLKDLLKNAKTEDANEAEAALMEAAKEYTAKFDEAMDDDVNTADAISAIFELVKFANTNTDENSSKVFVEALKQQLEELCGILGLIVDKEEEMLDQDIEDLIAERQAARKAKNFARADEIRNLLLEKGIILEDTREGVKWKRA